MATRKRKIDSSASLDEKEAPEKPAPKKKAPEPVVEAALEKPNLTKQMIAIKRGDDVASAMVK